MPGDGVRWVDVTIPYSCVAFWQFSAAGWRWSVRWLDRELPVVLAWQIRFGICRRVESLGVGNSDLRRRKVVS